MRARVSASRRTTGEENETGHTSPHRYTPKSAPRGAPPRYQIQEPRSTIMAWYRKLSARYHRLKRLCLEREGQLRLPLSDCGLVSVAPSRSRARSKAKPSLDKPIRLATNQENRAQRDIVPASCKGYSIANYFRQNHLKALRSDLVSTNIVFSDENSWRRNVPTLPPFSSRPELEPRSSRPAV